MMKSNPSSQEAIQLVMGEVIDILKVKHPDMMPISPKPS